MLLCRMMCFCPKHTPPGAAARQQQLWRTAAAAAGSTGSSAHQAAAAATARPQAAGDTCAAAGAANNISVGDGAVPHQPSPAAAQKGCARETPYNHALRRGQREPDAIAAALAKRQFVQVLNDLRPSYLKATNDLTAVQLDHRLRQKLQLVALRGLCILAEVL